MTWGPTRYVAVATGRTIESGNAIRPGEHIHGWGTVVKEHPQRKPDQAMCRGCRDDYYNHANADRGGCWCLRSAKVVDKVGHSSVSREGGPDTVKRLTLSCWQGRGR